MATDQRFQIHLRGLIDLLSDHLYSGPHVFIRELLQNGVDAIAARRVADAEFTEAGQIQFELVAGDTPTLVVRDNGVGLTEPQVHRFLATIGQSSKRDEIEGKRGDFIGQFGVGMLSCFMAADEITLITRSATEPDAPPVHWCGRPDGTYDVKTLDRDAPPGTTVYLRARGDRRDLFEPDRLATLLRDYGGLLPEQITLTADSATHPINDVPPVWLEETTPDEEHRRDALSFGERLLGSRFVDVLPIQSQAGQVRGLAYIQANPTSPQTRASHRVYLKRMLVSEKNDDLLPSWAVFVRCVLTAKDLRPVASREAFYADDTLDRAKEELGDSLRDYLTSLSRTNPDLLSQIVGLHHLSIKGLAAEDEESFRVFADHLPFETSAGRMTLGEYRSRFDVIHYVSTRDTFRQIAQVAAAQGLCVINAGYVYDTELLQMLSRVDDQAQLEEVDPATLTETLDDLTLTEREQAMPLLRLAEVVLQPFGCVAEIKRFAPAELPTLFTINADAIFKHQADTAKEQADDLWADVVDAASAGYSSTARASLCLNAANPLIQRLIGTDNRETLKLVVELLYVQALMLGHHPLSNREMNLLNQGLAGMLDLALPGGEERNG